MTAASRPDPALYAAHHAAVCQAFTDAMDAAGADTVVIFSGSLRYQFLDDRSYAFRANPHFMYWLPVTDVADSYIIYQRGETPILLYCQPDDYWHSVPSAPDAYWAALFDVRSIASVGDARAHLPEPLKAPILIGEVQQPAEALGIERINPSAALHSLDIARTRKSAYELERMRAANRLAARAHTAVARQFSASNPSEYDLHQTYLQAIQCVDSDLPYHSIIGLNEHAAILHYQHRQRAAPAEARTFLIDAGAESAGYASDVTRTYCKQDGAFADLIVAMDALQQRICAAVRPGIAFETLHLQTHAALAQLLVDSGLSGGSVEALVETGVTRALLPHGLGHYLGLQVHDVGGHIADARGTPTQRPERDPHLRLTRTLGNDEVVTIEPGLYFIDMLLEPVREGAHAGLLDWQAIDALRPFGGIRIEDNVRVHDEAPENLTRDAFAASA